VPELASLGWTPALEEAFRPHAEAGLIPGRVSLEHNHVYRVMTADREWLAEAAGRIKYLASGRDELPAVGDWVGVRADPAGGRSVIRVILPRRSRFSRKVAGRETNEQVLAANIDTVFLVSSLDNPVNRRRIERYVLLARPSGAQPVIVLNKADVHPAIDEALSEAAAAAPDTPVHSVSAKTGQGLEALSVYLSPGQTVALLGPSGAGKSSIVNALVGRDTQATGEVRDWDGRGRHTSVHRELILLSSGGVVIDTPGLRELQLWDASDDAGMDETFADIAELSAACRFRDCQHDREPGCAVKAAVEAGTLAADRHAGFLKLQAEREALGRKQDERAILETKRQARIANKALNKLQQRRER
jgi:ribosome biogenesis GTPase